MVYFGAPKEERDIRLLAIIVLIVLISGVRYIERGYAIQPDPSQEHIFFIALELCLYPTLFAGLLSWYYTDVRRYLVIVSCALYCALTFCALFGFRGIFYLEENNRFHRGEYLWWLPFGVLCVYVLLLAKELFSDYRDRSALERALCIFLAGSIMLTAYLEMDGNVTAMEPVVIFCETLYLLVSVYGDRQRVRQELLEKQNELLESQQILSESRITLLTRQIHRHFIYNSLVALKSLCRRDPPKAEIFVQNFSEYLRANLESMTAEHIIPFEKEMENIRIYLSLEQADPLSNFVVDWQITVKNFRVPALCVETLVENAVQHGIAGIPDQGKLVIRTVKDDRGNVVEVIDNGVGFDPKAIMAGDRQSVGLENIKARLEAGMDGKLEIESDTYGTTARIIVPE